jgi:hypothetical protein
MNPSDAFIIRILEEIGTLISKNNSYLPMKWRSKIGKYYGEGRSCEKSAG